MRECARTINLKLYDTGRYKKSVIDEAMINYSMAFQYLLDSLYSDIEYVIVKVTAGSTEPSLYNIRKLISSDMNEGLKKFNIEPFKDSLMVDFSAVILGYLKGLKNGREQKYPRVFISDEEFEHEYERLMKEYIENSNEPFEIEEELENLLRLRERLRPIYFCRNSSKRNFSLLYDCERNRYYAKIYLMNEKNEKRKKSLCYSGNALTYISKDKQVFKGSSRRNCFLVFPLSFGAYQEGYLKRALKNPDIVRTARLIKKGDEYFLSVNLIENRKESVAPQNYMGISRGIDCATGYAVVDLNGNKVDEGYYDAMVSAADKREINRIANCLIKIAGQFKCQIIMENLNKSCDSLAYTDKNGKLHEPRLGFRAYNSLIDVIDSKIKDIGLPEVIKVSSRDIFYSCARCSNASKLNRFSENIMICTKCGTYNTIEKSGSLNLARKLIKYKNDKIVISVEETKDGIRFYNRELCFEFYTGDPHNCINEFYNEIDKLIKEFYEEMKYDPSDKNFMKKLSMIKKIEKNRNVFELKKTDSYSF